MKEALMQFMNEEALSPFNRTKTSIRRSGLSLFKTNDAKTLFTKVLLKLSSSFVFSDTQNLWHLFSLTDSFDDVLKRQNFFKNLSSDSDNFYLRNIRPPRKTWSPEYGIVVVTEDEDTFVQLQKLNCPVQIIVNQSDLSDLERYDVVQVIDCEMFSSVLERLPQTVFIDSIEDVYLERYLEEFSGWKEIFLLLREHSNNSDILSLVDMLSPLFSLIDTKTTQSLTAESAEKILEEINDAINERIRDMTLSGDMLVKVLSEGKFPDEFQKIIEDALDSSKLPHEIFEFKIPVSLDYAALESYIQRQNADEFTNIALMVKREATLLKKVPEILETISHLLLYEDFVCGLSPYLSLHSFYPLLSEHVHLDSSQNYFLNNPQPISFQLDEFSRCSILTGANSGGKTTLLEHVIQSIVFFHLGLPVSGRLHLPMFSEVYYFAKNKGSASRGAFETLLEQMSKITPGSQTLILADEIEAVTEPGVAGKIIAATADYYIQKRCYLIIATHLGYEIQEVLPTGARIDGIEAKGLDESFNLIVDHNPVMGRLAHSTPELIVNRMAQHHGDEYFLFLQKKLHDASRT